MWLIAFMHDYGGSGSLSCKRASRPSLPFPAESRSDLTLAPLPPGTTISPPTSLSNYPLTHSLTHPSPPSSFPVPAEYRRLPFSLFLSLHPPPHTAPHLLHHSAASVSILPSPLTLFFFLSPSLFPIILGLFPVDMFLISFSVRSLACLFPNSVRSVEKEVPRRRKKSTQR